MSPRGQDANAEGRGPLLEHAPTAAGRGLRTQGATGRLRSEQVGRGWQQLRLLCGQCSWLRL